MLPKIYIIAVFCLIIVLGSKDFQIESPKIKLELLKKNDLIEFVRALNDIIDFSLKHKNELDINVYFGLFLVNVNLKRVLQEMQRALPQKLERYVKKIIWNTENLLDIFKHSIENNYDLHNNKYKAIFSLFVNATSWINRLPKFSAIRLNEIVPYLENDDFNWIKYIQYVDDRTSWVPNPRQSDLCLASLASAKELQNGTSRRCRVLKSCYEMVANGTEFGYALAHRLLFLQQARFGHGCSIFSEQEDRQMRERFCSAAYEEAQYIAMHDFEMVDLLLEHVCLCSLEGYVQFLKRSWLTKILSFKTRHGCFSPCPQSGLCKVAEPGDHGSGRYCNGHTTAVAAGTLAIASRFILEFYY